MQIDGALSARSLMAKLSEFCWDYEFLNKENNRGMVWFG
jgi:hypothetical protein